MEVSNDKRRDALLHIRIIANCRNKADALSPVRFRLVLRNFLEHIPDVFATEA